MRGKKVSRDPFDRILSAAIKDVNRRLDFYQAFLELEVVVLGTMSTEQSTVYLKYLEIDNELVLPVYSSLAKFQTIFPARQPYVNIEARDLLQWVEPEASMVVNPGFDVSKKLIPEELETLRDGQILAYFFEQLPQKEKERYLADQVTKVPDTTIELLSACLQTFPPIKSAYLTNLYNPATRETPCMLVGLDVEPQDTESSRVLFLQVVEAVRQKMDIQLKLEFVILDEALPLTGSIVQNIEPFYVRSSIVELKKLFH